MSAQVSISLSEGRLWDHFCIMFHTVNHANHIDERSTVWCSSSILESQTWHAVSQWRANPLDPVSSWSPAGVSPSLGFPQPSAWKVALGSFPPVAMLDVTLALLLFAFATGHLCLIWSLATSVDILFHSHLVASAQASQHVLIMWFWHSCAVFSSIPSEVSFTVVGCLLLEIVSPGWPWIISTSDLFTSHLSLCLYSSCWFCISIHRASSPWSHLSSLIHLSPACADHVCFCVCRANTSLSISHRLQTKPCGPVQSLLPVTYQSS